MLLPSSSAPSSWAKCKARRDRPVFESPHMPNETTLRLRVALKAAIWQSRGSTILRTGDGMDPKHCIPGIRTMCLNAPGVALEPFFREAKAASRSGGRRP